MSTKCQLVLFDCNDQEGLHRLLLDLADVAALREGTALYFYSQRPGQAEFEVPVEFRLPAGRSYAAMEC